MAIKENSSTKKLADIYVWQVVFLHGVSDLVVSYRSVKFTFRFWKWFHEDLGTQIYFSTSYHPQID